MISVVNAFTARSALRQIRLTVQDAGLAHVAAAANVAQGMENYGVRAANELRLAAIQCVDLSDRIRDDARNIADQFERLANRVSQEHHARIDIAIRELREANLNARNESALWRALVERLLDCYDRTLILVGGVVVLLFVLTLTYTETISTAACDLAHDLFHMLPVDMSLESVLSVVLVFGLIAYLFGTYQRLNSAERSVQNLYEMLNAANVAANTLQQSLLVGMVVCYAGELQQLDPVFHGIYVPQPDSSKPKWLLCNGAVLRTADFPELSNKIQNHYGAQDANEFQLPNFNGRMPCGVNNLIPQQGPHVQGVNLGGYGGNHECLLTLQHIPSHHHSQVTARWIGSGDPCSYGAGGVMGGGGLGQVGFASHNQALTVDTGNAGVNNPTPVKTVSPYLGMHFLIRSTQ